MGNSFFDRLQILIANKKISQKALADKIGVHEQTVSRWRKSAPDLKNLVAICDETGASLEWLKDGEGPMFKYQPPPGDAISFNFKNDPPKFPGEPGKLAEKKPHSTIDPLLMCKVVLESPGVYSTALASNAFAFYTAVKNEEEMNEMREESRETNKRIANLERMMAEQSMKLQQLLETQGLVEQKRDQKAG